jgi:hypothetical protein
MIGRLMNNELERIWKDTAVAYFKVLSQHLHGGTGVNLSRGNRYSDLDLNSGPPEYEGMLTTRPRLSMCKCLEDECCLDN